MLRHLGATQVWLLAVLVGCFQAQRAADPAPDARRSPLPPPSVGRVLLGYLGLRYQVTGDQVRLILCDSALDTKEVLSLLGPLERRGTIQSARFDRECRVSDIVRSDSVATTIVVVGITIDSVQAVLIAKRVRADRPPEWQERYVMIDWHSASLSIERIDTSID